MITTDVTLPIDDVRFASARSLNVLNFYFFSDMKLISSWALPVNDLNGWRGLFAIDKLSNTHAVRQRFIEFFIGGTIATHRHTVGRRDKLITQVCQ